MVTHVDVDGPESTSQYPSEAPHPQCAAAAMMHGMSMAPASSLHGGCPPIAENQEFAPNMPPPGMTLMQQDVIVPNPGYKIAANLWISILHTVLMRPVLLQPFYVIAIPWRVRTIQRIARKVHRHLLMTCMTSSAARPLRISGNCRSIARSLLMSQHAVVYGQKAFKLRSWMSRRKSKHGLQV